MPARVNPEAGAGADVEGGTLVVTAGDGPGATAAAAAAQLRKEASPRKMYWTDVMRSLPVELLSMVLTVYALYASDCLAATEDSMGSDGVLDIFTFIVSILFTAETALNAWVWEGYFLGIFFWLDVIATISMYGEVSFIRTLLFGDGGSIARAGRAARVGTRVGRILRLVRLVRVVRLLRIVGSVKEKKLKEAQQLKLAEQKQRIRAVIEEKKRAELDKARAAKDTAKVADLMAERDNEDDEDAVDDNAALAAESVSRRGSVVQRMLEIEEMEKEFLAEQSADEAEDASSLANQMSNMMTVKVVIGVLFMMMLLPILQPDLEPLTVKGDAIQAGLLSLKAAFASAGGNASDAAFAAQFAAFKTLQPEVYYLQYGATNLLPRDAALELARRQPELAAGCELGAASCTSGAAGVMYAQFDIRAITIAQAESNIYVTSFVICMLLLGAWSFSTDSNSLALQISAPLTILSKDMESIAMLDLNPEFLAKPAPPLGEGIREMDMINTSFFKMKTGIGSFAKYAPMAVVKNMMRAGKVASLGVERKPISILFSDIRGFTTICEAMRPTELLELLSDYFQEMDEVIIATDGILAEFIGDAILALWNCPQDVRLHGERCVEAAVGMQERVDASQARWKAKGYPEIAIRVGVHTSDVFVGNIGSRERMKYGVLGDGVNLASRLEELNKRYNTRVLCSQDTFDQPEVESSFVTRPVDFVVVKGKVLPTKVYEVMGRLADDDHANAVPDLGASMVKRRPTINNKALENGGGAPMSTRFYCEAQEASAGYAAIKRASQLSKNGFATYLERDFRKAGGMFKQVRLREREREGGREGGRESTQELCARSPRAAPQPRATEQSPPPPRSSVALTPT
jgi:class 3 adenylate cyclase